METTEIATLMETKRISKKFESSYRGKSQLVDYQNSATLLCLFEMRRELFGVKFSEGNHFPLKFRLDVQQYTSQMSGCI